MFRYALRSGSTVLVVVIGSRRLLHLGAIARRYDGGTVGAPIRFELDRRVLAALKARGAAERVTAADLAEGLGVHSVGVLAALERLERKGLARRIGTFTGRR